MPDAASRRYFDVDSYLLEPNDWLRPYADPGIRDPMRELGLPLAPSNERAATQEHFYAENMRELLVRAPQADRSGVTPR